MSKDKKARKARTPNVPRYTGPTLPADGSAGGGETLTARTAKASASPALAVSARAASGRSEDIQADYTHVVSDLRRIGLLAGVMLVALVALSFVIK